MAKHKVSKSRLRKTLLARIVLAREYRESPVSFGLDDSRLKTQKVKDLTPTKEQILERRKSNTTEIILMS